jgi:phosphoribosylaminoimidazole carboxylase
LQVGIIMGSDSDLATMKAAAAVLEEFGIPCEITVVSAHRTPERMMEYAKTAHKRGLKAIIAGAGGAAHLPGMVAAMTPLPVIGVPVKPSGAYLDGMDALLSIVQMPKGVPVATVAIGNAANAGLLAARIIATGDELLLQKMLEYQEGMKDMVLGKAARLEEVGWRGYQL